MIALRRLPREEWEATLRSYGCKALEGSGALNTAEFWLMPFQSYPFTVPTDDGYLGPFELQHLIALICNSAPDGWNFDPGSCD